VLKSQFWNRKATLNLAAFHTDIRDYQATVLNGEFGVLRGFLANAGKVRPQGIKADVSLRPSARFTAYTSAAFTDAKYVRFTDAPCPPELAGGTTAGPGQTPSAPGTPAESARPIATSPVIACPVCRSRRFPSKQKAICRPRFSASRARPIWAMTVLTVRAFPPTPQRLFAAAITAWEWG
jgi:hypothetical protein